MGDSKQDALKRIRTNLRTQDNRATSWPMFAVQQKRRDYGYDPDYSDHVVWIDQCNDCVEAPTEAECAKSGYVLEPDELTHEQLEKQYQETGDEPDGWTRTSYVDRWEFVTACFTEQGCKDYLEINGHNLHEPRIYAYSGWRNYEWQTITRLLLGEFGPLGDHPDGSVRRQRLLVGLWLRWLESNANSKAFTAPFATQLMEGLPRSLREILNDTPEAPHCPRCQELTRYTDTGFYCNNCTWEEDLVPKTTEQPPESP
jgi:hypothetical protein